MILIDFNQVLFAAVFANLKKEPITEDFLRHIILNTLRSYSKRFRQKYGKMVLCCERGSWRKSVFPFYKANRKTDREAGDIDWAFIFAHFDKFRQEFADNLPYQVVSSTDAEADDIIAVLSARHSPTENILIISSDKDFPQLQKYKNVDQYHPLKEMFIEVADPALYLKEHIIRGDSKDGIPNILSPDNTFVIKQRQKSINKKKLEGWLKELPSDFCNETMLRGFTRNQMLIDFDYIPSRITEGVVQAFEDTKAAPRSKLLPYLIANRLKLLVEVCDEF